ncbi:hypothetical protein [Providencia sp. JUb39]|uniref:hypothetical protein n=1 Tax=Providencia sp. JUb39 TaxID=2724165 RepID=UPI00164ED2CE|nr:hypothetical protein [Providencia sp. JUb39]MBC5790623.1 hypothetical protein [Providencia sp. JUb39]
MKTKRITFNIFEKVNVEKANGKLNVSVMEGKANKHDKSFDITVGETMTDLRKNASIKDGSEWQITSRFEKRHVKPTLVSGESVYCYIRAVKESEVYYLCVIKSFSGLRAVMHHKSKRNEYGVAIADVAKRFRTTETECSVKAISGQVPTKNGGSFHNEATQITASFFCKKEVKEVAPVIEFVEEVKEVEAVSEIDALKAEIEALKAENARLVEENKALKANAKVEVVKEEIVSVKEMSKVEKLELAKANLKLVSFEEEKEEVKPVNAIPQYIKEILLDNPSVEVWNKHVCHKYTLAPITMQDIFKIHSNDMDSWLVLKAA